MKKKKKVSLDMQTCWGQSEIRDGAEQSLPDGTSNSRFELHGCAAGSITLLSRSPSSAVSSALGLRIHDA